MKTEGASENTNYENENKLQALEPMWRGGKGDLSISDGGHR